MHCDHIIEIVEQLDKAWRTTKDNCTEKQLQLRDHGYIHFAEAMINDLGIRYAKMIAKIILAAHGE